MGGGGTYQGGGSGVYNLGQGNGQSPWTPIGGGVQNDPASPWTPIGGGQNNGPGGWFTGGAPWQPGGVGDAYHRMMGGGPAALRGYQGGPNRNFNQQTNKWQWNTGFGGGGGAGNSGSPIGADTGMQGINMNSHQSPMGMYGGVPIQAPNQNFFVPKNGQTNWI